MQKLKISALTFILVLAATITVLAQTNSVPFLFTPEETGDHQGDHQFPDITGSITVGDNYQGDLSSLATISQSQAEKTALDYTTGGQVVSATLEDENGYLVWSVTVSYNSQNYQILVDAGTGSVLFAGQEGSESE